MEPSIDIVVDKICSDPEVRKNAKLALRLVVQQAELKERMRVVEIASKLAGKGYIDGAHEDDSIVVVSLTDLLQALPVNK